MSSRFIAVVGLVACAPASGAVLDGAQRDAAATASAGTGGDSSSGATGGRGGADGVCTQTARKAYVGYSYSDQLVAFDVDSGAPGSAVDLLPAGDYPYDATFEPDGSEVWVVGASGNGIVVLDAATDGVNRHLTEVGAYPVDVAFSPDGHRAYVAARDSQALVVIDTATYAVTSVSVGDDVGKIAVDESGTVYFVAWYGASLYRYDPDTQELKSQSLGASLWDLAIGQGSLFVTDRGNDEVLVVDPATLAVTTAIPVGVDPWGIDITPDGETVIVVCEDDASLHLIDAATHATTSVSLAADADPRDVEVTPDGGYAFVPGGDASEGNDVVYRYDLETQSLAAVDLGGLSNANVVAVNPCGR